MPIIWGSISATIMCNSLFLFTMLLTFMHTLLSSLSEIIGEHFFGCVFVVVLLWVFSVSSPCASSLNNLWYPCPRRQLWQTHTQELQRASLSDEVHLSWKSHIFPQSLTTYLRSLLPPPYLLYLCVDRHPPTCPIFLTPASHYW